MNMITIKDINVLSNYERVICTEIAPNHEYVDGKPTKKIGTRYTCILEGNGYTKIIIKTPELIPIFTTEDIEANRGKIPVSVEGFQGKIYVDRRTVSLQVSCKATTVIPILKGDNDDDIIC